MDGPLSLPHAVRRVLERHGLELVDGAYMWPTAGRPKWYRRAVVNPCEIKIRLGGFFR